MREIKTYLKGAPFYNAFIRRYTSQPLGEPAADDTIV